MERNILLTIILPFLLLSCIENTPQHYISAAISPEIPPRPAFVAAVPLPTGYKRPNYSDGSFATWLRKISIKKDTTVYLYNGQPKKNQSAQYAVLSIPVGNKDLQQCADAVMRLRAAYFYDQRKFAEISFADNNGKRFTCPAGADSTRFEHYLEEVFNNCGTASLEKQLHPVTDFAALQPGDVFIKGGYPGHCVIVMDMAVNSSGKKIYLLAQSYMPAQDIHLLKNPMDDSLSPWYELKTDNSLIYTPEWTFEPRQLRRW